MTRSDNAAGSAWFDLRCPCGGSTSDEFDPTVRFRLAARGRTPFPIRAKPIGTGDQPRCFFWETAPTAWDSSDFDQRFMPMIRVDVLAGDGEPDTIAENVKAADEALDTKFGSTHETYIRGHICILLRTSAAPE